MTNRVYDDFTLSRFIENQIWIGRGIDTANVRIRGLHAEVRMCQKQTDNGLEARVDLLGSLRRAACNIVKCGIEVSQGWKRIA